MNNENKNEDKQEKDQDRDIKIETNTDLDDSVIAEENALELVKKIKLKLKECDKKSAEYLDGWQRAQADFVNYRKRDAAERQEFAKFAAEPVILDAIDVLDSFDLAFNNKTEWEKVDKGWRDGVERIHAKLRKALEKNGVVTDDPIGRPFEPMSHLAVEMIPAEKPEQDGIIVGVVQKGYLLNGKLIRPAKVRVGQMKS